MSQDLNLTRIESTSPSRMMPIPGSSPEAIPEAVRVVPLPPPRPLWMSLVSVVVALLLSGVLFGLAFTLYRKGNDFPVHYHPDERGKARQIATDSRNYRHPQLLLETTQRTLDHLTKHRPEVIGAWKEGPNPAFANNEPRQHAVALMAG